jgi:hypothetical protein
MLRKTSPWENPELQRRRCKKLQQQAFFSSTLKNALAYYIHRWRCSLNLEVVGLAPGITSLKIPKT